MKPRLLLAANSDGIPESLLAALSAEFEPQCFTGIESTEGLDFGAAAIVCVFEQAPAEEFLQRISARCTQVGTPVVLIARGVPPLRRLQVLKCGISEVLEPDLTAGELSLKLMRGRDCREQAGRIQELLDQLHRLSQYFSDDVVKMILSQKSVNHDYGENLEATIFFLDIRNFTTISENVEPNLVAALLNRLYTDIMDLILTYKGSVNKIIGDALLSTFGCPVRGENDAKNAVECALAIRDTLKLFNSSRPAYIQEDIAIGMGIATGRVFAGTIGSYRKRDYTVIGDTVNIAARLEGLTKQTRFDLIIDRKTRDLVGADLKVRKLQVNRVRGRTQPMEIFLVDSLAGERAGNSAETVFFSR